KPPRSLYRYFFFSPTISSSLSAKPAGNYETDPPGSFRPMTPEEFQKFFPLVDNWIWAALAAHAGTARPVAAASAAEQIVEPSHDAVASQSNAIALRRTRDDLRPVDIVASAEISVHEFETERKLGRDFDLDPAAQRPAGVHRRSLRDHAKRVGLNAGLDVAGGEAAFDIGQPVVEAVADAAGHRGEPGEPRGPHVGRGEVRTGAPAVEIGGRYRSLDSEHQPVVLKVIAELPAADHSAPAVARHRIQRRKKRG